MPTLPKTKRLPWIPKKEVQSRQFSNQSFYNSKAWRRTRNNHIRSNPLCVICKRKSIIKSADCVDHITPINNGGHKFEGNLQSLCNSCHNSKSSLEGIEYRNKITKYIRKK